LVFVACGREKELVAFALMIAFSVIMRAELGQSPGQRAFAEQNQLRQALLLGGSNPTFRKGVQIRDFWREAPWSSHRPGDIWMDAVMFCTIVTRSSAHRFGLPLAAGKEEQHIVGH
jgi:hypothetical protein